LKIAGGATNLPDAPGFANAIDWNKVKRLRPA
jgi:hypothetical protein